MAKQEFDRSAPSSATLGFTRTERKLYDGAERLLQGSGAACVDVYRCAKTLRMAATLSCFLQEGAATRSMTLGDMRAQVSEFTSSRKGPKRERYIAAKAALDELHRLSSEATQ